MQFKSFPGKQVRVGRQRIVFDERGELETSDKDVIDALSKAKNVTKVESRARTKLNDE